MQKNEHADRSHDHSGSGSAKIPAINSATQLRATTAAKDARIKEAGLAGNRTGKSSASGERAQAHRDAETIDTAAATPALSSDTQLTEEHHIQVQVNSDHNIHGSEKLTQYVDDTVNATLGRFGRQLTRVEIHLSDDNGSKSHGDDKRCLLEARPAGHQPLVVTHVGATLDEAIDGAIDMMEKLLDRTFHKLHDPKGRLSLGKDPTV